MKILLPKEQKLSKFWLACLFLLINLTVWAVPREALAQQTVTGTVSSADDGATLPGVTIKIKNTDRGTTTNEDGIFNIEASPNDVLVFSFIGFSSLEVTVGTQASVNEIGRSSCR